jgi:hypothetical protein
MRITTGEDEKFVLHVSFCLPTFVFGGVEQLRDILCSPCSEREDLCLLEYFFNNIPLLFAICITTFSKLV